MNFCSQCGRQIEDQTLSYCPWCGAQLTAGERAHGAPSEDSQDSDGIPVPEPLEGHGQDASGQGARPDAKKTRLLVIAGAAVAVVAIIALCVAIFSCTAVKELTEEQVLADMESYDVDLEDLTHSTWGSNEGYHEVSRDVTSIEKDGSDLMRTEVVIVLENDSFKVERRLYGTYLLVDREWTPHELGTNDRPDVITPLAGLSDDMLMEHVEEIFDAADEAYRDNGGSDNEALSSIYGEDAEVKISENNITPEGGSATFALNAKPVPYAQYKGNVTATFAWTGEDWAIESCMPDESAYQVDLSPLKGTWVGELEESKQEYYTLLSGSGSNCNGGDATPLKIVVTSVDSKAMTATADLTFVMHTHSSTEAWQKANPGDQVKTLKGVDFPVEVDEHASFSLMTENGSPYYAVRLLMEDGQLKGHTKTGKTHGGALNDYYVMKKQ